VLKIPHIEGTIKLALVWSCLEANQVCFDGWSCCLVRPSRAVTPLFRLLPFVMSRPIINRMSERVFCAAYTRSVLGAIGVA